MAFQFFLKTELNIHQRNLFNSLANLSFTPTRYFLGELSIEVVNQTFSYIDLPSRWEKESYLKTAAMIACLIPGLILGFIFRILSFSSHDVRAGFSFEKYIEQKISKQPQTKNEFIGTWPEQLEKMLVSRNPMQGAILDPRVVYGPCKGNVFLKNMIDQSNIQVGDFTYAHVESIEKDVLSSLVPYSFGNKKLIIGKFCSIGFGTQFISPYANHQMHSFTTFPFWHIFSQQTAMQSWLDDAESKKDTIIGNDVWFGRESMIMPGVQIGDGAVIAARSVVSQDVPPYAIVGGHPAKIIRYRFEAEIVKELLKIQWWNWDLEKIAQNHSVLMGKDLKALRAIKV